MKLFVVSAVVGVLSVSSVSWAKWEPYEVQLINGQAERIKIQAEFQNATETWGKICRNPSLLYMPEKNRLLLLIQQCPTPKDDWGGIIITSDDRGHTWSTLRYTHADENGKPTEATMGASYLGNGKISIYAGEGDGGLCFSNDYGQTWGEPVPLPPASNGKEFYCGWYPFLTDRDPNTGKVLRLLDAGWSRLSEGAKGQIYAQANVRYSYDQGMTWKDENTIPQWLGVTEVAFVRAKNGGIVAACRTETPERFKPGIDHWSGLAISISKDNGKTWSKLNMLYEWGRHHSSMVLLPNGDIVMTHVVRKGYIPAKDGFAQFGIEAIVSHDNGRTWDLDHKYIIAAWKGNRTGSEYYFAGCQTTSSVLMPDGSIVTAFGTSYLSDPSNEELAVPWHIVLIKWRTSDEKINSDKTIINAPFNSALRNVFDPSPYKPLRDYGKISP